MDGQDLAIGKGEQAVFHAVGYYDVGFDRDVTEQVTWHSSDETVGGFDSAGVFTGRGAGNVTVWAELDGQQSPPASLEVYATSELDYCDPANVNRGTWSDDFNRVTLESDCADVHAARRGRAALLGHRDAAPGRHLQPLPRPVRLQRRHPGSHHPRGRLRRSVPRPPARPAATRRR